MHGLATGRDQCAMVATKGEEMGTDKEAMKEIAKKLNHRLADVLDSISAKKGESHAVAIERALKTMAAVALLDTMAPREEKKLAGELQRICIDNITKLVSIIGIDPEDLHGASKASMADLDDMLKAVKK